MRQLAWLYAVPKLPPELEKGGKPNEISRYDQFKKDHVEPPLPPNPMPQFALWLTDIGIVGNGGMGPTPLSWAEIAAWQRCVGIRLPSWQARLMRTLSIAYIAEKAQAEDWFAPAPWRGDVAQAERDADEAGLDALFG